MTGALLAAAAILAVLELDVTAVGQFMVSRPAVLGPAMGAAFGQPALGTGLGALWELMSLDRLPCGGHLPLNATVAVAACLLLALGPGAVAPEAAFPLALAVSAAHGRLEERLRALRTKAARDCENRIIQGQCPSLGAAAAKALAGQALMTFALLAAVVLARPALAAWWPSAPPTVQGGLRLGLSLAPWAGLVALIHALRRGR